MSQKALPSGKQTLLGLQCKDEHTLFKFLQLFFSIPSYSFTQNWLKVKHFFCIPILVTALIQKIIELNSTTLLTKESVDLLLHKLMDPGSQVEEGHVES